MVILNKIYTKTGDDGMTSLGNGDRATKFSLRVVAYGTVDELNSSVGLAILHSSHDIIDELRKIQNDLFDVGADLCNPESTSLDEPKINELRILSSQVERLEKQIDKMNSKLKPLKSFVLPGGSEAGAHLHLCRTICRRAERYTVELSSETQINKELIKYLNRLSDWFFVASRFENCRGEGDINWIPGKTR